MMIDVKKQQLYVNHHFHLSMHCDLDLCPYDPKIKRAHSQPMGSLCVKFHDGGCKGKGIMQHKPFSVIFCIVTLTFDLLTPKSLGYILNSWGVCVIDVRTERVIPVSPPNFVVRDIITKD